MLDVVQRLRSISQYCDLLASDLLDPNLKRRFTEAARYFSEQAIALQEHSDKGDISARAEQEKQRAK